MFAPDNGEAYDSGTTWKDTMTRSYGSGPDWDRPKKEKQPELHEDMDFDSRLDSRLARYRDDDDTKVQAVRVDTGKRLVALIIDVAVCFGIGSLISLLPFIGTFINQNFATAIVLLVRDYFFEGRGIGKNLMGLQVVDVRTGYPCSFIQVLQRNIVVLGPLMVLFVFAVVLQIINQFTHLPNFINDTVYQVIQTIGTVYTLLVIPYEAYRVYSRADGRRFGDSFAGTAVVEAPMDFSTPMPRH
jgi:uncharacterized RDD family membrane protein YckC